MIKVSNLSKVFRTEEIETTALNGVSFEGGFYKFISCNFEWIVEQIAVHEESQWLSIAVPKAMPTLQGGIA